VQCLGSLKKYFVRKKNCSASVKPNFLEQVVQINILSDRVLSSFGICIVSPTCPESICKASFRTANYPALLIAEEAISCWSAFVREKIVRDLFGSLRVTSEQIELDSFPYEMQG
jgi:hypothetical protein